MNGDGMTNEILTEEEQNKTELISTKDGFGLIIIKYILESTFNSVVEGLREGHPLAELFHRVGNGKVSQAAIEFVLSQYQQAPPLVLHKHLNESMEIIEKQIDAFIKMLKD
jgi:hypothetical protein